MITFIFSFKMNISRFVLKCTTYTYTRPLIEPMYMYLTISCREYIPILMPSIFSMK